MLSTGRLTEEYTLDFDRVWNNPNGTLVVVGKDVEKEGRLLNVVTVAYQIYDMQDYDNKKYNAWMGGAGDKMKVTVPTIPFWMYNQVNAVHALEGTALCKQTKNAHLASSNAIAESPEYLTKDIIFKFPEGITCKPDIFNKKSEDGKLKNNFRLLEELVSIKTGNQSMKMKIPFVVWKFTIDEKQRILEKTDVGDDDEDITSAISRMSNMFV